jgi:hypothetical protein
LRARETRSYFPTRGFWVLNTDVLAIAMHAEVEVLNVFGSSHDPELEVTAGNDDCA